MPLYFVLSGLFFKDYGSLKSFTLRKTNKIVIPFLFFYIVSQTLKWLFDLKSDMESNSIAFPDYTIILHNRIWFNNAIWFLLCLFEINIIYYAVQRLSTSTTFRFCYVLVIGILGATLSKYKIMLPIYLDTALTAMPFFFVGTLLKHSSLLQDKGNSGTQALIGLCTMIILIALPSFISPSKIRFVTNEVTGSYLIALISSVIGVVSLLLVCKKIKWLPLFSYIGRYSIVILCVHMVYIYILNHFGLQSLKFDFIIDTLVVTLLSWLTIPIAIK